MTAQPWFETAPSGASSPRGLRMWRRRPHSFRKTEPQKIFARAQKSLHHFRQRDVYHFHGAPVYQGFRMIFRAARTACVLRAGIAD
jgi:hypothetical protein